MKTMRLKDIPQYPAYIVFHDAFDNGAMDVYPAVSFAVAKEIAANRQNTLEENSCDDAGHWRAYEKLPRVRVHSFRTGIFAGRGAA